MRDIALLVEYFLTYFGERLGVPRWGIDPAALAALEQYDWPGNVRELINVIESAYTFGRSDLVTLADLPATLGLIKGPARLGTSPPVSPSLSFAVAERELI